ncbi:MAG: N-acetylglucosamine-6-phosphate deacetylase [Bacilli bacterium]
MNAKIYLENNIIENGYLIAQDGIISEYGPMKDEYLKWEGAIDAKGLNLVPGFIDQHIHGGYGFDFIEHQKDLNLLLQQLPQEGTTSVIATTLTQSFETLCDVVSNLGQVIEKQDQYQGQTIIEGIHLEGPYLNVIHKGAQNEDYIIKPSFDQMDAFIEKSNNNIIKMSFAPEVASPAFQNYLMAHGINQSVVHSDASYSQVKDAMKYGINAISHFHNGSSGHHHRKPGVVSAGLGLNLKVELIVDGIHLDKDVVEMVNNIKGPNDIILITDSMAAKNLADGEYSLGGLTVNKVGFEARLENGALAGSCAAMDMCARNFKNFTNSSMSDIVKVTSYNAAKLHNLSHIGVISVGKVANLVICDDQININKTIIKGQIAYTK